MRTLQTLFALTLITLSFSACGPSVSSRDQENQQIQDNVQRKVAELSPYAGTYFGKLKNVSTNATYPVRLFLQVVTKPVVSAGRTDVINVPMLVGSLMACDEQNKGSCMDLTPISNGTFNSATQKLELSGNWGDSDNFMTFNVNGDNLEGYYVSKREYSYVSVTRTHDDQTKRK